MNKFEELLNRLSELKPAIRRILKPQELTKDDLSFYDYLTLKEIFIKVHQGKAKDIYEFEENVKANTLDSVIIKENGRVKSKKVEYYEPKKKEYHHKCNDKLIFNGKKIIF